MSSSDSDDCYGNIAQKLRTLKKKFVLENFESDDTPNKLSEEAPKSDVLSKNDSIEPVVAIDDDNLTANSDDLTLDSIIAQNSKPKRVRKAKKVDESFEPIYEWVQSLAKRKTRNSEKARATASDSNKTPAAESCSRPAKRGRGRGKAAESSSPNVPPRGRRRGNSRGTAPRGTTRRSARGRNTTEQNIYPTFSIGNTDEYPDLCDNQELFSTKTNDVEIIDNDDPLDNDNEELSVKVYWQSLEVIRFQIRKYQKLTPIFNYFSEQEGVGNDKLLFTYNNKILTCDDTPDSIDYSIAKFIDGGIVNSNISGLVKQSSAVLKNGLPIKFQCQNLKKPFETMVSADEKLLLAMTKCAEHLEVPLEKLRFYFDGDLVSSRSTPQELDLEGGECIDVKVVK